jgi:hypothetical protein
VRKQFATCRGGLGAGGTTGRGLSWRMGSTDSKTTFLFTITQLFSLNTLLESM